MATQDKIKPGDLVQLNSDYYSQDDIDQRGLGLYLELKYDHPWIYWFNYRRRGVATQLSRAQLSRAQLSRAQLSRAQRQAGLLVKVS